MMRRMFVLILLLLLAGIIWTSYRFWQILSLPHWGKWLFTALYLLSFLVIFPHFIWGDRMPVLLAAASYELGTSWMIFFVYALLIFTALSIGRLIHLVSGSFLHDSLAGSCTVFGILTVLLIYGSLHYRHKYREELCISVSAPLEKPLTVVLASDLHLGYHNRRAELSRWVDMINAENPDMVLIAGDIIDGSLRPVREWNYAAELRRISAPVYACLGNHEYISGRDGSEAFYKDAGIILLRDSAAVCKGIDLIGRDDRSNRSRKPLSALVPEGEHFSILLDHQPYALEEAEEAGVDFQFSGHTHHGQIWPGNWITDAMYEKAFGTYRRGNTRYYISSGLGIWGGKFRIGTRSEYVVLKLQPGQ